MNFPELYTPGIRGSGFNFRIFWTWVFSGSQHSFACVSWWLIVALPTCAGFMHSLVVFFLPYFSMNDFGLEVQSMTAYTCLVIAGQNCNCLLSAWI